MKKKTVITTEKREVWVVREAIPEPPAKDQPLDVKTIEVPSVNDSDDSDDLEGSKNNDD